MLGEVQRHCQRAHKTCDTWPPRRRQFPGKEDVQQTAADREIGKTPVDIDDRGGFADAARRSERRLKRLPQMPCTVCGMALARNAPANNQAT
jgi:hypothetical protein